MLLSGDTDSCVPVVGTRQWVEKLELTLSREWEAWNAAEGLETAGFRDVYKEGLQLVTVKGTGHMST